MIVGEMVRVKEPSAFYRHNDLSQMYLYENYYDQTGSIVGIEVDENPILGGTLLTIQFGAAIEAGWLAERFTLVDDGDVCSCGEYNDEEFLALLGGASNV